MKLIMYGTNACPDCVHAEEVLKDKNISYIYLSGLDRQYRKSEAFFETQRS